MIKKTISLLAITSVLFLAGCQGGGANDVDRLGQFLGQLSCLTAETDGQMTVEQIDEIGAENGFNDETEVQDLIGEMSEEDVETATDMAIDYVTGNCQEVFDEAGVDPEQFLSDFLASF